MCLQYGIWIDRTRTAIAPTMTQSYWMCQLPGSSDATKDQCPRVRDWQKRVRLTDIKSGSPSDWLSFLDQQLSERNEIIKWLVINCDTLLLHVWDYITYFNGSTAQPLKFGNGYVVTSHSLLGLYYVARQLCGITPTVRPFCHVKRRYFIKQHLAIPIFKHMENMFIYTNMFSECLRFGVARYCLEKLAPFKRNGHTDMAIPHTDWRAVLLLIHPGIKFKPCYSKIVYNKLWKKSSRVSL